jgi:hypothetical protein
VSLVLMDMTISQDLDNAVDRSECALHPIAGRDGKERSIKSVGAAIITSTKGFPPRERRPRRDSVPIAPGTAFPQGRTEL